MSGAQESGPGLQVAESNAEQARGWDGDTGDQWVENADRFDDAVAGYHEPLLAAADIGAADRVLDVGCGTGQTTRDAARRATAGTALGVDLSARMLALARRRAGEEGVPNASFRQADAQVFPFDAAAFDLVLSRHGTMFFGDPVAAFANLARAVRPGGRFAMVTWQPFDRQEWLPAFRAILAGGRDLPLPGGDEPGPFALGDPGRVRAILGAAGLTDVALDGLAEPMSFGADEDDAARFVGDLFAELLRSHDVATRDRVLGLLREDLAAHRTDRGVRYGSAAWLVTARRPLCPSLDV